MHARPDVREPGLDGGEARHGTTEVDVDNPLREAPGPTGRAVTSTVIMGVASDSTSHRKRNKRHGTMLLPVSHKAFVITQHDSFTVTT